MPSPIHFYKYQATGNDFLLFDTLSPDDLPPHITRALCDRHFGIGADGILLTQPPPHPNPSMIILNADGSRPEMCANGLRCVALHHALSTAPSIPTHLTIRTDAGPKHCLVHATTPTPSITLGLGLVQPLGMVTLTINGAQHHLHLASAGNPHAILLTNDHDLLHTLGPAISSHPFFPFGTNASFARLSPNNRVDLTVWERGVGPTLACGTATAATVAALCHARLLPASQPIAVHLPGGTLLAQHDPATLHTSLTGPAALVFHGQIPHLPHQ